MDTHILLSHLNTALQNKLTSINQYFLHARMLKYKGFVELADQEYKSSIGVMKHADMLVEHILTLGGSPNLHELGQIHIGQTPHEMLYNDLRLTKRSMRHIQSILDHGPLNPALVKLLSNIMESQQERADMIDSQLELLATAVQPDTNDVSLERNYV